MKKGILSIAIFGFVLFAFACGGKSAVKQNESEQTPAVANTVNSNSSLTNTNAAITAGSDATDKSANRGNDIQAANATNTANPDTDDIHRPKVNQKRLDGDDVKGKTEKPNRSHSKAHRDSDDKDKHDNDDDK